MPVEVEAKFLAEGPEALTALASEARLADALLAPPRIVQELDRYLDTADGRLDARRWACRLRERPGRLIVSLKGPRQDPGDGWLHRRPEVEGPAGASLDPARWPASEARSLVESLARGAPLVERFRLRQERTERRVTLAGRAVGTLSLDAVTVEEGDRDLGRLFMVELELADAEAAGADSQLERLGRALEMRPGLRPDGRTKLEHALRRLARP